jgi:hypothetical protein
MLWAAEVDEKVDLFAISWRPNRVEVRKRNDLKQSSSSAGAQFSSFFSTNTQNAIIKSI